VDRGAMAAHYGSTSLVTFTAALVLLETSGIPFEGFVTTLLAVLEVPGIIVGLMLAQSGGRGREHWGETLREVVLGRSIVLLVGGLVIGVLTGAEGYARVEPFFGGIFTGVLALFLLHLGSVAGGHLGSIRRAGPGLVVFALGFPVAAGAIGVLAGSAIGMSTAGAAILGVLCASASYIAAPAAVGLALPRADGGLCITSSLGITFPFNLVAGIPLLVALSMAVNPA